MSIRVLNTLTENAYQIVSFITAEGEKVKLTLRFIPSQEVWILDVESPSLTVYGISLSAHPNLLDSYKNIISWGLYVWSRDGFDPWRIDDFSKGRIKIAVLEDLENSIIEDFLNG